MVPDVQTLCLQSSICSTPKQLYHFVPVLHVLSHCSFMVSIAFPFNYLHNSQFKEAVFPHKLIVKLCDSDAKFLQVIGNLCPPQPLLLLSILSTPLDFNHRYSRGSANEYGSPRVHPKVTHLKPRTTRGKHFPQILRIVTLL